MFCAERLLKILPKLVLIVANESLVRIICGPLLKEIPPFTEFNEVELSETERAERLMLLFAVVTVVESMLPKVRELAVLKLMAPPIEETVPLTVRLLPALKLINSPAFP